MARHSTGTRITISDKYALLGNGNLVENTKRETSSCMHTAFFQNHNFVWSLPRNIGHRPSKCQEFNKFYIFTYLWYWFLLFMLFWNISWPDLTKRTRSLPGSQQGICNFAPKLYSVRNCHLFNSWHFDGRCRYFWAKIRWNYDFEKKAVCNSMFPFWYFLRVCHWQRSHIYQK